MIPNKHFNGEDKPVVGVVWYAAVTYCHWLSLLEAAGENLSYDKVAGLYRLPSEIEWEWAAAGGKREYPWGNIEPYHKLANYENKVGTTTPVGRYPDGATPEGLMDMAGNVWEWMENWYDKDKDAHCLRGGSWNLHEGYLRCMARHKPNMFDHSGTYGFRVVRTLS